jgi:hypothetical protein
LDLAFGQIQRYIEHTPAAGVGRNADNAHLDDLQQIEGLLNLMQFFVKANQGRVQGSRLECKKWPFISLIKRLLSFFLSKDVSFFLGRPDCCVASRETRRHAGQKGASVQNYMRSTTASFAPVTLRDHSSSTNMCN